MRAAGCPTRWRWGPPGARWPGPGSDRPGWRLHPPPTPRHPSAFYFLVLDQVPAVPAHPRALGVDRGCGQYRQRGAELCLHLHTGSRFQRRAHRDHPV
jgi:hypothetical protein